MEELHQGLRERCRTELVRTSCGFSSLLHHSACTCTHMQIPVVRILILKTILDAYRGGAYTWATRYKVNSILSRAHFQNGILWKFCHGGMILDKFQLESNSVRGRCLFFFHPDSLLSLTVVIKSNQSSPFLLDRGKSTLWTLFRLSNVT